MSLLVDPESKAPLAPPPPRPAKTSPATSDAPQAAAKLYRTIWRWHFYAGMAIAPFLFTVAATGGLYVFKSEIESLLYADLIHVTPGEQRVSYESLNAAALASMPADFHVSQFIVPLEPDEAVGVNGMLDDGFHRVYVDPYRGEVLGTIEPNNFFTIVLSIHRTLFIGTVGRIVVELTTCWAIVVFISGVYLWWPRNGGGAWGIWLPRWRGWSYVSLRDVHAVSGAYVAIVALVIAFTGLFYSYFWGQGYRYVGKTTGAFDVFRSPPNATAPTGGTPLDLDAVIAKAATAMPGLTLTVRPPADPTHAYVVFGSTPYGATTDAMVAIDQGAGEILEQRTNSDFPALARWLTWNYPLHVGSILGLWTKIPWLIVCLVLMIAPLTGVWMWWLRRPTGTAGLPKRYRDVAIPRAIAVLIVALCLFLPVVGISLAVILAVDWLWSRRALRRTSIA